AALTRGINKNSFQTVLATIGITNQCYKKSYYNYQIRIYKPIIDNAKFSSETILLEILDQLELTHLSSQEKLFITC
ncbi:11912_t:CDS:1, partial [Funneliformis caledonium]